MGGLENRTKGGFRVVVSTLQYSIVSKYLGYKDAVNVQKVADFNVGEGCFTTVELI